MECGERRDEPLESVKKSHLCTHRGGLVPRKSWTQGGVTGPQEVWRLVRSAGCAAAKGAGVLGSAFDKGKAGRHVVDMKDDVGEAGVGGKV